jgi:hypothetical protein
MWLIFTLAYHNFWNLIYQTMACNEVLRLSVYMLLWKIKFTLIFIKCRLHNKVLILSSLLQQLYCLSKFNRSFLLFLSEYVNKYEMRIITTCFVFQGEYFECIWSLMRIIKRDLHKSVFTLYRFTPMVSLVFWQELVMCK